MALATVAWMPHGHALALVGGLHVSGPSFGKDLAGLSLGQQQALISLAWTLLAPEALT